ncbi:hypothetical protein ABZ249_29930 [Nocardiopsis sp. NPDC006139]|uniref:hypothetical protein n=1 Tax=Nocardiopsis sp. NPDC006139 TaxID=3154578 RepID=UPI0033B25D5A
MMDLDAIEQRTRAATEGPWWIDADGELRGRRPGRPLDQEMEPTVGVACMGDPDAAFAAAARTDVPALVARVRELEEENAKLRLYLSHAVKFSFGTDMASHAEVTRAEQNRPDGDWFFRSWEPTERHATQEAALEAALERARENGGPQ